MHPIRIILMVTTLVGWSALSLASSLFSQTFDESFGMWPVDLRIGGTVIAGGGSELPSEAVKVFVNAAGTDPAIVIIRFEGAALLSEAELKDQFASSDEIEIVSIPRDKDLLTIAELATIQKANAIWIAADQRLSVDQSKTIKTVLGVVAGVVNRGGVICINGPVTEGLGQFQRIPVAGGVAVQTVSNLIPNTVISAGYRDDLNRADLLSVLAAHPRCVGIGIEVNTAIVLQGRKIRAIGDGRATFCLMANELKPLRIQQLRKRQSRRASPYETVVDLTAWRRDAIDRTVAPFPQAKPPIPIVENGTLLIVGGGGMPNGLMEEMVRLAGGKQAKMVFVPCTESESVTSEPGIIAAWKRMGVKSATVFHTKDRVRANSDEEFLAPLKDATGIWFGGGRQWNLADSYYGTRAHELMKDVLARGGVIGGSSAGASIQACYLCRANPVANFDIMAPGYERGLGFIGGIAIDQHFSQRRRQKDMTQLVQRYPQLLGVGIDESTALIVKKSDAEIVGRGKVYFYDRAQPVIPGTDDFTALGAGSHFDLETRKVIEKPDQK